MGGNCRCGESKVIERLFEYGLLETIGTDPHPIDEHKSSADENLVDVEKSTELVDHSTAPPRILQYSEKRSVAYTSSSRK